MSSLEVVSPFHGKVVGRVERSDWKEVDSWLGLERKTLPPWGIEILAALCAEFHFRCVR